MKKLFIILCILLLSLPFIQNSAYSEETGYYHPSENWIIRVYSSGSGPSYSFYIEVIDPTDTSLIDACEIVELDANPSMLVNNATSPDVTLAFDESTGIAFILYSDDAGLQLLSQSITSVPCGGTGPGINVTPNPLNFSDVNVNSSLDRSVLVNSTGDENLVLTSIGTPGSPFYSVVGTTCSISIPGLPPGNSCSITVRFSPTSAIAYNDSFTISSNAGDVVITLLGNGVDQYRTISGYVRTSQGIGISRVRMSGDSCSSTNGSGYYSCTVSNGWSGTITPSKSRYSFSPTIRSYSNVIFNMSNENYTGYSFNR